MHGLPLPDLRLIWNYEERKINITFCFNLTPDYLKNTELIKSILDSFVKLEHNSLSEFTST